MNISEALKKRGVSVLHKIFEMVKTGQKADISELESYVADMVAEVASGKPEGQLVLLNSGDDSDYAVVHSVNVAFLSIIFALRLKTKTDELHDIALGALLHDIGKINTPDQLIWKQEGENDYEKTTISEHVVLGSQWMKNAAMLPDVIIDIIRNHHENFLGTGYPAGIPDRDLSQAVRIVSICNYFEHLIHDAPGKPALLPRDAFFEVYQQANRKFALKIASKFVNEMGPMMMDGPLYQKTALVLLDTREVAAVMKTESFGDSLPEILILTNSQGTKLARPLPVNLKKDNTRKIVKLLKQS